MITLVVPMIEDTLKEKANVKRSLVQELPLIWEICSKQYFDKLWKSISERVAAVLEAN